MEDNWFNRTFRPYSLSCYKTDQELKEIDAKIAELEKQGATRKLPEDRYIGTGKILRRVKY